jgi:hypothetical protein
VRAKRYARRDGLAIIGEPERGRGATSVQDPRRVLAEAGLRACALGLGPGFGARR